MFARVVFTTGLRNSSFANRMRSDEAMIKSTTILALISPEQRCAVMACDGQATMDTMVIKRNTRKVYRLNDDRVLVGFAGATADCLALLDRLEGKLKKHNGQLRRAAVDMTKEWRTDRILRQLEAIVVAVSEEALLMISGAGDVLEPDEGIVGIGSGGAYALAAGRALLAETDLPLETIARKSLEIAGAIEIYTNQEIVLERITW